MTIHHCIGRDGTVSAGFTIRNRANKVLAYGTAGFVTMAHQRYFRDYDLCRAIARLTGVDPTYRDRTHPLMQCRCGGYVTIETR